MRTKSGRSTSNPDESKKRGYSSPKLIVYGSVRDLTGSSSGTVGDGAGMNMLPSDRAYKDHVVNVGMHPAGFGLYVFEYRREFRDAFGHGRQFGVMADEVEAIVPDAVAIDQDGYRRVDYARLGITRH